MNNKGIARMTVALILTGVIAIAAIAGLAYVIFSTPPQEQQRPPQSTVTLNGAGATFPYPVYSAMITQYYTLTSDQQYYNRTGNPKVQINYNAIGSGGGISALQGKTVDFAGSDAPLQPSERANAPNSLTIPGTIGAVTVAYNLPGIGSNLHLTGQVIADIFSGKVTTWNDPEIASLNSNVTLPARDILVVHRSDGSGTTFTFTGYLSLMSSSWNTSIGQGKTVAWPVGLGASGNAGVAGVVQGTKYTIGYVELAYALQNKMTVAAIQNKDGNWILPTLASSAAAAQNLPTLPAADADWSKVNMLNELGANSYPIVTFSYIIVYKDLSVINGMTLEKATALVNFLYWEQGSTAQSIAQGLSYVPLPQNVVTMNLQTIQSITFNGTALIISTV